MIIRETRTARYVCVWMNVLPAASYADPKTYIWQRYVDADVDVVLFHLSPRVERRLEVGQSSSKCYDTTQLSHPGWFERVMTNCVMS